MPKSFAAKSEEWLARWVAQLHPSAVEEFRRDVLGEKTDADDMPPTDETPAEE